MSIRTRKCKVCKSEYRTNNSLQICCSLPCALEWGRLQVEKKKVKEWKIERAKLKEKTKSIRDYKAEAQMVFNKYIRLRDKDEPCISCGRYHEGQFHSGHFRARSVAPHLTFNEDNVWKQCSVCNNYKSGNLLLYRTNLINKIGLERVEALENNNTQKKWTIEELKEIKRIFSEKIKSLL